MIWYSLTLLLQLFTKGPSTRLNSNSTPRSFLSELLSRLLFCDQHSSHVVHVIKRIRFKCAWVKSKCSPHLCVETSIIFTLPSSLQQCKEIKRLSYLLCTTLHSTRPSHNLSSDSIDFLSRSPFHSSNLSASLPPGLNLFIRAHLLCRRLPGRFYVFIYLHLICFSLRGMQLLDQWLDWRLVQCAQKESMHKTSFLLLVLMRCM